MIKLHKSPKILLLLATGLALPLAAFALTPSNEAPTESHAVTAQADAPVLRVVKTPSCSCCGAWIDLAREEGFDVVVEDTLDYAGMKQEAGVPEDLWSCHTAEIEGYAVEGHVPFAAIEKLLAERPEIDGIAVPGMPAGSPGMGDDPSAVFDVIAFGGTAGAGMVFHTAGQ